MFLRLNEHSAHSICRMLTALALCLALPLTVSTQSDNGRITGTVRDQNGAVVRGATVTVRNEATNEERTATTSNEGVYTISLLKPAIYTVMTSAPNFETNARQGVEVLAAQNLTLDIVIAPIGVKTDVTIIATTESTLDTDSARNGANVNPREIEGLPLNGRQLSQLYLQAPGSQNTGSGTFGDIRFSGRSNQQNVIRYDGVEGSAIIDASPGNINGEVPSPFRLQTSLENVQEFRADSNNFTAEYGTGTGGQISVVTKSGSNQFHGSLFEYFRNSALDAANFFDNIVGRKSPLRLNQFGGSGGGPIVKDRLFFFGSYEGYRLRAGINTIEAVPGAVSRICAPATTIVCNATSAALISGGAFRAPNAAIISTGTGGNLFDVAQLQANAAVNENSFAARFDARINERNSAYFRFFRDQGFNIQPEGVTGRNVVITANPQNAVASLQTTLSSSLLNEFKVGYNGAKTRINGQAPTIAGVDFSALTINISGNTANFSLPGQGSSAGTAVPGGLVRANSATNGRGQPYTPYTITFFDNLNYTRGNHNVLTGGEIRLVRLYTDRLGGTTYTYSNLTNFLTGTVQSIQYLGDLSAPSPFVSGTGQPQARQTYYIAYGQDTWKIRPNLTLSYGLRYEYYTPLRERNDRQVLFDITTGQLKPNTADPFKSSKNNFGPRVALTYAPNYKLGIFGGGRTLLRGGFGIYYGPGQTEDQIQPIESNRISSTFTANPIFPGGPALAFQTDPNAFAQAVNTFFVNNPNNRSFQPRAYANDYTIPEKVYQYTVSIQQELPYGLIGTAAYVGSQGRNLFLRGIANLILPGQAVIAPSVTTLPSGVGVVNITNATGQVIAARTVRQFSIISGTSVLNPYAEIDFKTSGGHDSYNAAQFTLARRFTNGLTLNSQYTYGKSVGNTQGSNEARTAAVPNNFDADYSRNTFDIRHNFNLSALYTLPFGRGGKYLSAAHGLTNVFIGGWEVGTIVNARSGLPIEVLVTRPDVVAQCINPSGCTVNTSATTTTVVSNGFTASLPTISSSQPLPVGFIAVVNTPGGGASRSIRRPDLIPGVNPYLNNDRNLLNPAAFAIPQPGTFGNLGRNALEGPGFSQFDLVFNKRFAVTEHANIEFRTEIFNVLNRTNFANPSATLNNALPSLTFSTTANAFVLSSGQQPGQGFTQSSAGQTFGLLRQTVERTVGLGTNRQIQFALRLNF